MIELSIQGTSQEGTAVTCTHAIGGFQRKGLFGGAQGTAVTKFLISWSFLKSLRELRSRAVTVIVTLRLPLCRPFHEVP